MRTYSGNLVTIESGAPSIVDIAVQTGRMPRFAGSTGPWWSVLHHHLVCYSLALSQDKDDTMLRLHCGLHDAHEAITGDCPTTWKPKALKKLQKTLDRRIYKAFGLPTPNRREKDMVRVIDRIALMAEAAILGPPGFDIIEPGPIPRLLVKSIQRRFPVTIYPDSKAVSFYVARIRSDMEKIAKAA